ncbi:hypothetical protein C6P45_004993 [Maudiozyma exigua]|uniref:DH domain-containing protein n=1 Tax=Maudiozyma exigua TaxID=34358 RepID=A0A9P6WBS1_MAUEX|nr:hypothetical protein C6P45_004993 [Kazachstania exigua]
MVMADIEINEFSSIYSHDSERNKHIDHLVQTTDIQGSSTPEINQSEIPKNENDIVLFNNYLSGADDSTTYNDIQSFSKIKSYWTQDVFDNSKIYTSYDDLIWGKFVLCIHHSKDTYNCLMMDDFGIRELLNIRTSLESLYYGAVEGLNSDDKNSEIKKCIAILLLRRYSELSSIQKIELKSLYPTRSIEQYDPAHAGQVASGCIEVKEVTASKFGERLISQGFLDKHIVKSTLIDVIYESKESTIELNNRLVFHLGEQLEQLFNPITEYSPEQTEYGYKAPDNDIATETDTQLVEAICNELLEVQSNFTFNLVEFLQKFLITLRVQVLNNEIEGLSTVKLNRLFPPTIDEVTRINCIFLDSLKSATPFGSFEVLKACNLTIPYFYKAYTRHEAATKNFSKDIKLFIRNFSDIMPNKDIYTEMKLETIIKGPQEKMLKLKLIIDRLYKKKVWSAENSNNAKKYYDNIIDIINSFGHLEAPMSSYNTRVFTPSGKILTELAKGWPVELQYKWLKRRIVGVFDIIDSNNPSKRNLLVIFSDYIVFLNILNYKKYYTSDKSNKKPLISDILMNSLINELPLPPKIPKLEVEKYCYINDIHTSVTNGDILRFDAIRGKGKQPFSMVCQLASKTNSADDIADLITKAKILEKDTAFHLFKSVIKESTLYFTAHELESYNTERIKSKFGLFLNMEPSNELLISNDLHSAAFAKFTDPEKSNMVKLTVIRRHDRLSSKTDTIPADDIVCTLMQQLSSDIPICYSSILSEDAMKLVCVNNIVTNKVIEEELFENITDDISTQNIASQVNEENKKSYGTITTFRSDVSDLVDVPHMKEDKRRDADGTSANKASETKKESTKTKAPKSAKKSSRTDKTNQKKTRATNKKTDDKKSTPKERKNKGFFGAVKSIFSNSSRKEKRTIGKPVIVKQKTTNRDLEVKQHIKSKSHPLSPVKVTKPSDSKTSDEKSKLEEVKVEKNDRKVDKTEKDDNSEEDDKVEERKCSEIYNVRISSVVHNIEYTGSSVNTQQGSNKTEITNSIPKVAPAFKIMSPTKELPDIPVKVENDDLVISDVSRRTDSFDETEGNDTDIKLANPITHQSKLFDNDLFGDFIPEKVHSKQQEIEKASPEKKDKIEVHPESSEFKLTLNTPVDIPAEHNIELPTLDDINLEPNDDINEGLLTDIHEPRIKKKVQIFPEIANVEPPRSRIKFEKSPSFIELFRDMRIVLDDSDAKYNWKRLSTEVSLNEKYLVNNEVPSSENVSNKHGLKTIVESNYNLPQKQSPMMRLSNVDPVSPARQKESHSETSPFRALAHNKLSDLTVNDLHKFNSEAKNENITLRTPLKNPVNNASPNIGSPSARSSPLKTGSIFKVINKSPTRITNSPSKEATMELSHNLKENRKFLEQQALSTGMNLQPPPLMNSKSNNMNERNIASDFSFASDFNGDSNRRWVKLNVNSKEDLLDDTFHTPLEEPSETFSDALFGDINVTTNSAVPQLPQIPAKQTNSQIAAVVDINKNSSQGNHSKEKADILDDLEFSSFDMTFNTSTTTNDMEPTVPTDMSNSKNILVGLNNNDIPKMDPPVVYKYSKEQSFNTRKNLYNDTKYDDDSNEPFWISPSKVDFTSLTKSITKPTRNGTTLNPNIYTADAHTETPMKRNFKSTNREINLTQDMSFAFLGSLVDIDGTGDNLDDQAQKMYLHVYNLSNRDIYKN